MNTLPLSNLIEFQKKSHIKAGDGLATGECVFFTSSVNVSKFYKISQFDKPSLIFGTGGNASIHICESPFAVSTDCLVAQLKPEVIKEFEVKYIYYYLFGNIWVLEKGFRGAGLKHISKNYINEINIPELPKESQKRIVKILDQAEAIRQKRKQSIELLDDYMKSVFLEMFGNPLTNSKSWKEVRLGDILTSMTSGSRGWAKFYADQGSIFLTIKNVGRKNELLLKNISYVLPPDNTESKRTKVRKGDILLSITADLGRTAVVPLLPSDAYINQHLAILRVKVGVDPNYVSHYLSTDGGQLQIKKLNKGAAKAGLNFYDIKSIKIPLPPIELQVRFSTLLNKSMTLKQKMIDQFQELDNQFQVLMQKSFHLVS